MEIEKLKQKHTRDLDLLTRIEWFMVRKDGELNKLDELPDTETENSFECRVRIEELTDTITNLKKEYYNL